MKSPNFLFRRPWRLCSLALLAIPALIIFTFWYAINSDKDDISPILRQLMPAGHCACESSTVFKCDSCLHPPPVADTHKALATWEFDYRKHAQNEGLHADQCATAFPGLFEDPIRASAFWERSSGPITRETLDAVTFVDSMTRALIYDGNLYIIATKSKAEDHRRKMVATLSAIHRALVADPERASLQPIEFIFSVEDKAEDIGASDQPIWVLARKAQEESLWLMPDFGYWAWDNIIGASSNELGPYDEVVGKAKVVEERQKGAHEAKIPKLVWRGKLSFAPKLRRALLDESRGKEWGDVKELNWNVKQNYLTMEDHCRYMFIAHAEGRSYSASLKYRQACRSVIVIHKLQYIQHHHYLLISSGPHQNYVEVERDFSDLDSKMTELLADPKKAQAIADNSVRTFRERYLTPAAEACYWRALWRAYANVSEPADLWRLEVDRTQTKRGLRYETFVLLSSEEMMDFRAS